MALRRDPANKSSTISFDDLDLKRSDVSSNGALPDGLRAECRFQRLESLCVLVILAPSSMRKCCK